MYDLVGDHILYCLPGRLQVLARIKMIGMLNEILADIGGHSKTDVGVDIDLADSEFGGLTQLILRNPDGIGHVAAVFIDHLHKL